MQMKIAGRRVGYDAEGRGTPLLLMHAFPLNRSMFGPQREGLAKAARVLTFDAPGVGESEPGPAGIDDIADLAVRLLDELRVDKTVVGGVSMGGYAAFSFIRRHSDRLLGVVLANTKPSADAEEAKAARREMAEAARQHGSAEIAKRLLSKLIGPTTLRQRPAVLESVRAMIESADAEAIAVLLESLRNRADAWDLLPQISVPALVIGGVEDALMPQGEEAGWPDKIPDATVVHITGAGHLSSLEAPDAFNSEVETFLRTKIPAKQGRKGARPRG